eukprot:TRINITY_DN16761_c0_g2_i6.p2 TRINITY_DN16761_c0_g2~~TRINITY_DN16761_c0_g2_i6.p2  ORF type:complete len:168 (-),score=49.27 TRINITY_DN16761_c0_g2_i6:191-694(-)
MNEGQTTGTAEEQQEEQQHQRSSRVRHSEGSIGGAVRSSICALKKLAKELGDSAFDSTEAAFPTMKQKEDNSPQCRSVPLEGILSFRDWKKAQGMVRSLEQLSEHCDVREEILPSQGGASSSSGEGGGQRPVLGNSRSKYLRNGAMTDVSEAAEEGKVSTSSHMFDN